ncbi:MAG: hypothetical protein ACP5IK_00690 [Candidatus Micrarchaeia archaeon]
MQKYSVLLLLLALINISVVYYQLGYYWDLIAHILYAKGIITGNYSLIGWERAPLTGLVLVPFYLIFKNAAGYFYMIACILLLFAIAIHASKKLDMNESIMVSLVLTPFPIIFYSIFNGAEILSFLFLLVGLLLFLERKYYFSFFIALAILSKVIAAPFAFLILFSNNKRKAISLLLAPFIPWLAFNYIAFGNPIFNYIETVKVALHTSFYASSIGLAPLLTLFLPFFAFYLMLMLFCRCDKKANKQLLIFLLISLAVLFAGALMSNFIYTIPRWSYIVYAPLVFVLAQKLDDKRSKAVLLLDFAFFVFSILLLPGLLKSAYNVNERNQYMINAIQYLNSHSYREVASNVWTLLDFYNISAIPPYENYSGKPILIVKGIGTSPSLFNFSNYTELEINENASLYLPAK